MTLVHWQPVRDLVTTQDRFNHLFNDTFARFFGDEALASRTWAPAVDVYETDHKLVLKVELPGVDPKNVEVRIEDNTLYLKGERKLENEVKEDDYRRIERTYGSFTRTFALPSSIDAEKVSAEYKDGILNLTIAKREEAKPKTIKISVAK